MSASLNKVFAYAMCLFSWHQRAGEAARIGGATAVAAIGTAGGVEAAASGKKLGSFSGEGRLTPQGRYQFMKIAPMLAAHGEARFFSRRVLPTKCIFVLTTNRSDAIRFPASLIEGRLRRRS